MALISIIKVSLAEFQLDSSQNIIIIKFTNSNYNRDEFFKLIEYFKNFWVLAKENNTKYYMLFDIKELGIYPLHQIQNFKDILVSLEEEFKSSLHCTALLTENDLVLTILKPLFNMYKAIRPFTILKTLPEVQVFFNKSENQNSN